MVGPTNQKSIKWTEYPNGLYDIDRAVEKEMTWDEFKSYFSVHLRLEKKFDGPGFGPYTLGAPSQVCFSHKDRWARDYPHRCDSCVLGMSLACFDVDVGTPEQIEECSALLVAAGLAHLWYTSYSFTPEKDRPPFRLIIPLSEPILPDFWSAARKSIAAKFKIPCDIQQCSGLSHFYFLPACPPDAAPYFEAKDGNFLDISTVPMVKDFTAPRPRVQLMDWVPPEDPPPGSAVDLEPLKNLLRRRQRKMAMSSTPKDVEKADLIRRCLAGEVLAEPGKRNNAIFLLCGVVAWTLPGTPLSVLMLLVRPSVMATNDGGDLTEDELERMLLSAMQAKAEYDARQEEIKNSLTAGLASIRNSIPRI